MDKYHNYAALAAAEPAGAYAIHTRRTGSPLVIATPHGGGIEPGTTEITLAIAGDDLSFYIFEGKKSDGNHDLHITSARFDEPQAGLVLCAGHTVVTVHGEDSAPEIVYLGGRSAPAITAVRAALEPQGFVVQTHTNPQLQGLEASNICNLGSSGAGLQMELSEGLRRSFFESLTRSGRKHPTPRLAQFSLAVRTGLAGLP